MTDLTFDTVLDPIDRDLESPVPPGDDIFEARDPEELYARLQQIAEDRVQVATDSAGLRLG